MVPLFGDMQIAPFFYVKKTMHFDASKWPLSSQTNAVSPQVKAIEKLACKPSYWTCAKLELL